MYHRFRMMAGTTEDPAFAAAVDVAVDVAQNITLDEMSWNIDTGSWMGSQDVAGVNSTLTSMNTKLDMILARHETSNSNRRFAKRVSCCPPLCSFFIVITHDVVLFFTSVSTTKKHGVMLLVEKNQSARKI